MSAQHFTLREGSEADLPAMAELDSSFASDCLLYLERRGGPVAQTLELSWRRVKPEGSRRRFEESVDRLRRHVARSERLIVAEKDGAVAGYLILAVNAWNEAAEVVEILVDLPFRERGLGKQFVECAVAFARERRLRALQWEAQNDNRAAIEFACAHRFRVAGVHDAYYENRGYERQEAGDFVGLAVFLTRELD